MVKKRSMANLEYSLLARELAACLAGARIEKIFELEKNVFRIRFHAPGKSLDLFCELPVRLHLTALLHQAPATPSNFCMFLRKRLEGARVESVEQHGFDRIIVFKLASGDSLFSLLFELFSNGNVILLDSNGVIEGVYRREEWKDRILKPGEKYAFPPSQRLSPFDASPELLQGLSSEKPVITVLASSVNLGAVYLENALFQAGVNPKLPASDLAGPDWQRISESLRSLSQGLSPLVFYQGAAPVDYALVPFVKYASLDSKQFPSFSEALDEFYAKAAQPGDALPSPELEKLSAVIRQQKAKVEELAKEAGEARQAGDWIYANFDKAEKIISTFNQLKKEKASKEKIASELARLGARVEEKTGKIILSGG